MINAKSSMQAELVRINNLLGYILWERYFIQEQGYHTDASLLYQNKMSAILLETKSKASSLKWTKHIKVRYFYVKDTIN
jgi:hypothetical protein